MTKSALIGTILSIALAAAVLGSVWMIAEVGVKETYTAITDPASVNAETNETFGSAAGNNVTFDERIIIAGAWLTLLGPGGFAAISVSRSNPAAFNTMIRYGPLLVGAIAVVAIGSTISDVVAGDFDWDSTATTDGFKAYVLFATGSAVAAVCSLLKMNNRA